MKYKLIFVLTFLIIFLTERLQKIFYVGFFDLYPARVLFIFLLPFFSPHIFGNFASKEVKVLLKIIAVYLVLVLISALNSPDIFYSFKKWLDLFTLYSFIFLTYGFFQSCFVKLNFNQVFKYWLISLKIIVLVCFFGALVLERQIDDGGSVRSLFGISFTRRISFFADPNYFSTFLIMAFSILFFSQMKMRFFYTLIIIISVLLTGSKGGMIALFLALFFYYRKNIPFFKTKIVSYLAIGLIGVSLLIVVFKPIESIKTISSSYVFNPEMGGETILPRILVWSSGMKQFQKSPILGLGPGNIVNTEKGSHTAELLGSVRSMGFYGLEKEAINKLATHSNYLEILYEHGLIAFFFYIIFVYKVIIISFRAAQLNSSKFLGFHIAFSAFSISVIFLSYYPYFFSFLLGSFLYLYDKYRIEMNSIYSKFTD